jgi:3-deoxy-D-manno-octulosonic-acid transferase
MPWLFNIVYGVLLLIASPVLLYRRVRHGKYRDGWSEKLWGRLPVRTSDRPCVWLHAVSVGEVLQLRSVMKLLVAHRPNWEFVITTTTRTGLDVARREFAEHTVCYCPLDFSWATRTALLRLRPTALVLVELELWPNLIATAKSLGVTVSLINGRLSPRSFRGYRRVRWLVGRLLRQFDLIAVQNAEYAQRFLSLGASTQSVAMTGSIKFDGVQLDRGNPQTAEIRRHFGLRDGETVFIAGSTQAPEESLALDTWQLLRDEFPSLRLILVPRHAERFDEVANLVASRGLPLRRRTDTATGHTSPETVLLLDTLGELGACWGLADIAFVGGSLTRRGGQNMLEPAAYGAAVLFGPNTQNFRDIVEQLLSRRAALVVSSGCELTEAVRGFLRHPARGKALGDSAREFVASQQGAAAKTVDLLLRTIVSGNEDIASRHAA